MLTIARVTFQANCHPNYYEWCDDCSIVGVLQHEAGADSEVTGRDGRTYGGAIVEKINPFDLLDKVQDLETAIETVEESALAGDNTVMQECSEMVAHEINQLERDMIRDHIVDHRRQVQEDVNEMHTFVQHLEDTIGALWEELRNVKTAVHASNYQKPTLHKLEAITTATQAAHHSNPPRKRCGEMSRPKI